jgi:membrane glycosyltransferase
MDDEVDRMSAAYPADFTRAQAPDLPPEAPLDMPVQSFAECSGGGRPATSPRYIEGRRLVLILATAVVTLLASASMAGVAASNGISLRELLLLLLFCPLFAWIAFAFSSALAGFFCLLAGHRHESLKLVEDCAPPRRTAVLMPIHNEEIGGVVSRLRTMMRSLAATGHGAAFDFFILSDTTEPLLRRAEANAWRRLRDEAPLALYYRLRPRNIGRKPGNIAEWVTRFGGSYEHMIILDADSLMSGEAMVGLAATMEREPGVALIQTMPVVAGCRTFFARWQQFAARLYSPVSSAGLLWWSGSEASFWGHNAILRVRAFASCCGLPDLPGRQPLGGAIMSHDLVEAALLRRQGWACHMVDLPNGSYEEYPPTPIDHAVRDRRWCQGNLQHLRLLGGKGFHWVSRLQLLMGGSSYATSPLWLLLLIAGIIQRTEGNGQAWAGSADASWVFGFTLLLLFGPKLLALTWTLMDRRRRAAFGGAERILATVIIEVPLAMLMAPMVMITQTIMLVDILRGRSSGWSAQRRDVEGLGAEEALRFYRIHMLVGGALLLAALLSPDQLVWIAPAALGLIAAPWLAMFTSRRDVGLMLARDGLFVTPEERDALRIGKDDPIDWRGALEGLRRRAQSFVAMPKRDLRVVKAVRETP